MTQNLIIQWQTGTPKEMGKYLITTNNHEVEVDMWIGVPDEYDDLVPRSIYVERCDEIKELQELVMTVTGHKCIYDNKGGIFSYCDNCPLAHFDCGKRKDFSK